MVMLDTPAEAGGIVNKEAGSMIVAATLVIVIATTFLVGGSTPAALKALNIKIGDVDDVCCASFSFFLRFLTSVFVGRA